MVKRTTVSNRSRLPSWMYCPMECRSVVNSTLAGKTPFPSLPSLSPKSCFHHSPKARRWGSYPARISMVFP